WYKDGILVNSDNTPPVSLTPDTASGGHFGEYRLLVYRDPLGPVGGGCGFESDVIVIDDTCNTAFPVEWLDVNATKVGGRVNLEWQTAMELNNKGFEVEIARDNDSYQKLAYLPGVGTSQIVQSYRYETGDLVSGLYRFRIKQIDLDGDFTYSPVVQVAITLEDHYQANVSPVPAANFAQVEFEVHTEQPLAIDLYRMDGSLVRHLTKQTFATGQRHHLEVDVRGLASGMYFLQLRGATFVGIERLIVQH
ncbi:MAG: T9SS type A sorting domain-containing protein, partial [Bacteroidota bacterium]